MADLEFRLPGAEYEAITWVHNEHFTGSVAPLEASIANLRQRINAEDGLPGSVYINGYSFGRDNQIRPSAEIPDITRVENWRAVRLPPVDDSVAEMEAFDPETVERGHFAEVNNGLQERWQAAFGGVHSDTMGVVFPASAMWVEAYTKRFGNERELEAATMLAGVPNASNARAAALWDLGRIAAGDAAVLSDVRAGVLPTQESAAGVAFQVSFAALLESYGFTTTMHLIDLPTWREDPAIPLAMIAAMADEPEERSPQRAETNSKAHRLALEAELTKLDDDEELARLHAILPVAQWLAPASEDHNLLCDQRMIAASRLRWLRIGAYLRTRGVLNADDDVFYLTIDELYAILDQDAAAPSDAIRERRAAQLAWRAISPPSRLGAGVDQQSVEVLRGVAASAGTYRGRARVVATLNDAAALQPGEVLVAPATSPEWTPYFGVAGALVSATGSLLAHAAVVAREFGIPAVVGARGATQRIKTGDMLAVDGAAGIVTIEAG